MAATTTLLLPSIAFILLSIQAYSLPFIVLYEKSGMELGIPWLYPSLKTSIACEKVKNVSEPSEGYNIVGLSQVKNYISLGGPHASIASVPLCGSGLLCVLLDYFLKDEVYTKYVQEHCAPRHAECKFLPKLNNEVINMRNSTYKKRFESLENLVLIMFENDTVLVPKETSLFGYYPDGAFHPVLPAQESKLYTEDWIGLKTLDGAGKVQFITVAGNQLQISQGCMEEYIVPYLEEDSFSGIRRKKYISHPWFSSF